MLSNYEIKAPFRSAGQGFRRRQLRQNSKATSHGKLPDFRIGDIQLQVHQVSLSTLVQLAVLRDVGQEGVLGIKWSGRKDKHNLGDSPAAHSAA